MGYYPDVHPGEPFKPSAQEENDIRRMLNAGGHSGVRGTGAGVNVENICINAYNPGTTAIASGTVVTFVNAAMVEDAVQVAAMAAGSTATEWAIAQETIESHQFGSVLVMGAVIVPITGETGAYAIPVGGGGSFARAATGIARILRTIGTTSALILVGSASGGEGVTYAAGNGINSDLLTGGTISGNYVGVGNVSVTPVVGSTNGQMQISFSGGGGGATGIEASIVDDTPAAVLIGGTGAVKFTGEGTVQVKMNARRHATEEEIEDWGRRYNPATGEMDGDWKNAGWRGIITLENGDVMTEYGMSDEIDGVEVGYPLIVPDTTDEELDVIAEAIIEGDDTIITQDIIDKALDWAEYRLSLNKSPFYNGDAEDEPLRVVDDTIIISGQTSGGGGTNQFFPDYTEAPYPPNSPLPTDTPISPNQDMWLIGYAGLDGAPSGEDYVEINFGGNHTFTLFRLSTYYESIPSRRLLVPVCMPISSAHTFTLRESGNVTSDLRLYYL